MHIHSRFLRTALILLLLLVAALAPVVAPAQSDTGGAIAGQVAGTPGNFFRALITIRNAATGIRTVTLSDVFLTTP